MISSEYVDRLCYLFSQFTQPDNAVLEATENEVNKLIESDPIEFIHNCSAIIMDDNIENNIIFYAIQNIARSLSPYDISINIVRKKWMSADTEIRDNVKMAVFRGIMFQEENITNISSKALCILAIIERNEFFPVISQLISLIVDEESNEFDQEQSERFAQNSLYVLNEILNPPYYPNYINDIPGLTDIIAQINEQIINIFFNRAPSKSDKYKEMVVSVIISLISCCSSLYQDFSNVEQILQVISQYFESGTTDNLFDLLYQVLYNLVENNYNNENFDFSVIIEIAVSQMIKQISPAQFISSVIFWNCLSKFEFNILQKDVKYLFLLESQMKLKKYEIRQPMLVTFPTPKLFLNLTSHAPPELIDILLSTFTMIDPNDLSSEPIDSSSDPHSYAACCLINIFKINHRTVFNSVKKFWSEIYTKYHEKDNGESYNLFLDENIPWTEKHALLLSISVICENMDDYDCYNVKYYHNDIKEATEKLLENIKYEKDIKKEIISFLTEESIAPGFRIFNDFVLQAVDSPIPRIVDTAFYTIKMCLKYQIGTEINSSSTFSLLMETFKKLMTEKDYDEVIFQRILYLLSAYFEKFGQKRDYSLIHYYSEDIFSIISFGLSAPSDSYDVYILTNKTLENFIRKAPLDSIDLIFKVLDNSMNMLIELMQFDADDMNIIKQQQMLNIIMVIFKLKYIQFDEKKLLETTEVLFHLLEQKNTVFDDALNCLIIIIKNLENESSALIDKVLNLVPLALSSESPSIIQMTAFTLSYLYKENTTKQLFPDKKYHKALPQNLIDALPQTVQIITSYLKEDSFPPDFYPDLLKSLASLISASCVYMDFTITEEIKAIYEKYIPNAVNQQNSYELESVFRLFESIFAGFSSILKIYSCFDEDTVKHLQTKKNCRSIFKKVTSIYIYLDDFTDSSLKYYCKFLYWILKFFGTESNTFLNNTDTFKPLLYAYSSKNDELRNRAFQRISENSKS